MIRFLKAATRVVRQELASGESGWVSLSSSEAISSSGVTSAAGKIVSEKAALNVSAVWACVSKTAQIVSTLPLDLFEKQADGSRVKIENDLSQMVKLSPNTIQTGVEHWEGQEAKKLLSGNAYSEKILLGKRLVGLRPLHNVKPVRISTGFKYRVTEDGRQYDLPAEKVLHMRGFGAGDGLGLSAVSYGANSMGLALAADETAGAVFANGLMASGILKADQSLTEPQRAKLQEMLEAYTGSKKAGKVMALPGVLEFQQLQFNPEDIQMLETRRFSVEDVCRWFGTPPIVIGHASEGQTMWGSGVESIMLSWLTTGINPLLCRNEARFNRDLIPIEKRRRWYFEYNREAMLQMDSVAKGEFLSKMRTSGIMSADEARTKINLPKRGGAADQLIAQTALAPLEKLMTGEK
ncbi:phage portal protein [Falsihalocynthiibacter sp. BN13B15]|uniref:phage portal protein n=1 Tax=Falsihalocynthiibacter sp. BN13B15 TaxID=3240871 RepID=UPI003510BBCD